MAVSMHAPAVKAPQDRHTHMMGNTIRPHAPALGWADDEWDLDPFDVWRPHRPEMGWQGRLALAILVQTARDAQATPNAGLTLAHIHEAREFLLGRRDLAWLDCWCTLATIRTGLVIDFAERKGWGVGIPHMPPERQVEVIVPLVAGHAFGRAVSALRADREDVLWQKRQSM